MAAFTANGLDVLEGTISMPRVGAWHCDLALSGDEAPDGALTLTDGTTTFRGTIIRSGALGRRVTLRAVGGNGGLRSEVTARHFVDVPLSLALRDILGEAKETPSTTIAESLLSSRLLHWTRPAVPAGSALSTLLDSVGAIWRVLADGTIWAGVEDWPEQTVSGLTELDPDPELGTYTIASDTFDLRPGTTFLGRKVSRVQHTIGEHGFRTVYWAEDAGLQANWVDRIKEPLAKFIRWVMRDVRYHKQYQCVVQRQASDGTLDLYPDDTSIRGTGTSKIKIRHGIPGVTVKVPVGARVLLGFENGDPRQPYASLWDEGSVTSICFDGGTQPLARLGDLVQCGGPGTLVTLMPPTGVGAPPNNAVVAGVPHMISFSTIPPSPATADPLYGAIASGNTKFTG